MRPAIPGEQRSSFSDISTLEDAIDRLSRKVDVEPALRHVITRKKKKLISTSAEA
jgi:hypothetical protein